MATEHNRDLLSPLAEGEFQRIPGIGPGIAQRLHAAGVQSFSRLAALSPQEIYALLSGMVGLTAERIAAQDWPGRSQALARQLPQPLALERGPLDAAPELEEPGKRQHYTTFMVELLQDENHCVRRTRVVHVQDNEKDGWAGWDPVRLDRWITTQAAISALTPVPAAVAPPPVVPASPLDMPASAPAGALPEPALAQPAVEASGSRPPQSATHSASAPKSLPRLPALELNAEGVYSSAGEAPQQFLNIGQPFEVRLSFTVQNGPEQAALLYRAAVETRLPGGQRLRIAEAHGPCSTEGPTQLAIPAQGLEEGVYRFRITLLVYPEGAAQPEKEGRFGLSESGPVYVFSRESVPAM